MTPEKREQKHRENRQILKALSLMTQLGLNMIVCVGLGVLAGKFLDGRLGTSPWLLIVCSVIGAMSAFKVLYDTVIKEWLS